MVKQVLLSRFPFTCRSPAFLHASPIGNLWNICYEVNISRPVPLVGGKGNIPLSEPFLYHH